MRLGDLDALCDEFKRRQRAALRWKEEAILADNEESKIRADAILSFLCEVKLTIDNAPTVERPKGEWIEEIVPVVLVGRGNRRCRCSLCGHRDIQAKTQEVPYCWWCGAKMMK